MSGLVYPQQAGRPERKTSRHCTTCAVEWWGYREESCWSCGLPSEGGRLFVRGVTWLGEHIMTFPKVRP